MGNAIEGEGNPSPGASLRKKARVNIVLFLVAIIVIILGVYLNSQPNWIKRADIELYNQGAAAYPLPAQLLPATDDRPSEYPIVRAAAYFQQAASESSDDRLITLTLYNLGTLMGGDALTVISGSTPWFGLPEGISKLAESVRADPDNEDAKYNLELLEKLQDALVREPLQQEMPMASLEQEPGYYLGEIDKGY